MNKILTFLFVISLFSISICEERKEYYPSGNIKSVANFKDSVMDGNFKGYYENGILKINGKYKNGLKVETWAIYFENGKLKEFENYDSQGNLEQIVNDNGLSNSSGAKIELKTNPWKITGYSFLILGIFDGILRGLELSSIFEYNKNIDNFNSSHLNSTLPKQTLSPIYYIGFGVDLFVIYSGIQLILYKDKK